MPVKKDNLYLFLTNNIGDIGGGQLYMARKIRHLKEIGWRVEVWHFDSTQPVLEDLKPYSGNHLRWLCHRYTTLTDTIRQRALREMSDKIVTDRIVIESYTLETGLWGEALAASLSERMEAVHLCFLLTETPRIPSVEERGFLEYKYRQGLLKGISDRTLSNLLPGLKPGDGKLYAFCTGGNVADIESAAIPNIPVREDFAILSVGRLEKPYVPDMLEEIAEFAVKMDSRGKRVRLFMVGDTHAKELRRRLKEMVAEVFGLRVDWCGFLWPVPRELYRVADIFVGVSGAVEDAVLEGIPSIVLDASDHQVIGLYGETTSNELFRSENEPPVPLSKMLWNMWLQKDFRRELRRDFTPDTIEPDYAPHDEIALSSHVEDYYDVSGISPRDTIGRILRVINKIGGEKIVYLLKKLRR